MSIYVMIPVFETTKLTASEKLVALSLADNAHDDGTSAYPSISTTAAKTALSERTIQRILQSLVEKKILAVQKEATNNFPTTYLFLLSPDRKYLAVDWPGGVMVSPQDESRGDIDDARGDIDDSLGCHGVTQTINKPSDESNTPPSGGYSDTFEAFWKIYPRHKEKDGAFQVWKKRIKDGEDPEELTACATSYAEQCSREETEQRFIKLGATFLGPKGAWKDYRPETIDPAVLVIAERWDQYDRDSQVGGFYPDPPFDPRPTDANGNLLDGEGRAYYRDPMQPTKRRYLDDE